ncbi:MAG: hypothetical protein ACFFCI_00555 [Promethearchaeota archaeon]
MNKISSLKPNSKIQKLKKELALEEAKKQLEEIKIRIKDTLDLLYSLLNKEKQYENLIKELSY